MQKVITAKNRELPVTWLGYSTIDGSLRFGTTETDMTKLFEIFNTPEETKTITHINDEASRTYEGFTTFKRIEKMGDGTVVIGLMPG